MKKNHTIKLAAILWLFAPSWGSAQIMALQAVGSSGGTTVSGAYSLAWTVGEAAVMAAEQGDIYVGAGFQQAKNRRVTVGVFSVFVPSIEFNAFPNPAGDLLMVASSAADLHLRLFDLLGQQVLPDHPMNGKAQLHLGPLPAGMYILHAYDETGRLAATAKIQHIEY